MPEFSVPYCTIARGSNFRFYEGMKMDAADRDAEISDVERRSWNEPAILVSALSLYAIIGGIVTLIGWAIPAPRLTDWAGRGISMFPNAGVCSIACGMALILLVCANRRRFLLVAASFFAVCGGALGGMSLFQHITGINLGIDEFLFEGTWGQTASAAPMRIGVPASTAFLILGTTLVLAALGPRSRRMASVLAVVPLGIASLSLVGYWFGADQLFGIGRYTGISWQTATIVAALGLGAVAALRECGLMALLLRRDAGGIVARKLLLPIIVIPLLLGWMTSAGRELGIFEQDLGTALRTLVEIGLFLGFLFWTAKSIAGHAKRAREASDALSAIEERFTRFMQSLPGLAWIKDSEGRYVYANDAAVKAFQCPRDRLYGRTDAEILPTETAAEFMANDQRALVTPEGLQIIESLELEDGQIHSSLVSKFPVADRAGAPVFVGGIAIDISDRLRAEEELREAHRRKDEFIATLAHELRNPLAPIRYSVQICRNQPAPAERDWALDVVDRQVQQMARLLDDLLDVSRISYGKLSLRMERVDLARIVDSAIETSQPLRDAADQTIQIELPPMPIILEADPVRLEQVFANLLNNAAKYGGKGSQVWLKATTNSCEAVISIRDNGAGIPPERLMDIFEMFSQVKSQGDVTQGGLGIGLSLVRGLVDLHGGRVVAHSEGTGKGSEFKIYLPFQPAEAVIDSENLAETPALQERKTLRLLVADDLRDSADSVAAYFRANRYEVRTAYDGEEALMVADEFRPEAVFLDVGMPKLNGHEVCRKMRAQPWGKDILIVAITGWGQQTDRQLTAAAGFDHHLVKPVEIEELLGLLQAFQARC